MAAGRDNSLVLSYLDLRKAVGIIGIALPFVLVAGRMLLEQPGILSSISSYYYSVMGDVFVGSLWAIGVFLLSYRGYERADDVAGDLACVFAIGVAVFPTAPDAGVSARQAFIGGVHLFFAACFFLTLSFFALKLFRKTDPAQPPTRRKLLRNAVYTLCGYTMLACLALIVLHKFFPGFVPLPQPVFWLESLAITAFGISWFVKGEAILQDEVAGGA